MNLVVDTSVWSLVLRRRAVDEGDFYVRAFKGCVESGQGVYLIGAILQELLDGINREGDWKRLLEAMRPFPLLPLSRETYVSASQLRNHCRKKGIQASPIDFLIAAVCVEQGYPLLTADRDFYYIAKHTELRLVRREDFE